MLQWPFGSEADFEVLLEIEDALDRQIPEEHGFVDGHDSGAGEMNIFIHTPHPLEAFQDVWRTIGHQPMGASMRAAYRATDSDRYRVIWPENLNEFSVA